MENKLEIVVLDGFPVNPGDISWDKISSLGNFTLYDRTKYTETVERGKNADVIFVNKVRLDENILSKLPKLKYIGLLSTGTDIADLEFCRKNGITVTNIPGYSTGNVAQMVFAYILSVITPVKDYDNDVHHDKWVKCPDFCFQDYPLSDIAGKTIGIIGYGQIGRKVASIARAFDMKVVIYSRTRKNDISESEWVNTPEEAAEKSDFLTLHCPLTDSNLRFVNRDFLSHMKNTSFLINTARGKLIDEDALADYLNKGKIAGACVDVLTDEPPKSDNPLLTAKNCMITPHVAWASKDARIRLMDIAANNLKSFLKGCPENAVGGTGK